MSTPSMTVYPIDALPNNVFCFVAEFSYKATLIFEAP